MSGIFDQIINYSPPLIVSGTVNYKGTWNASTNNPTLNNPPATSTKGDYYVVSTAGTQFSISFAVGDWIISNGTAWEKVDLTDAVSSVFGRTGAVVGVSTDYSSVGITGTAIGASSPSTGAFTTVSASTPIAVASGGTGVSTSTGTTNVVLSNSPTIVTPVIAQINDASGNETLKLASIASAVNEVTIENAATGNAVHISATGGDASVGLHLAGKGASGYVNVQDSVDGTKRIMFNAAGGTTNTRTMLSSTQTVDRTISLPDATDTLVGKATTDTLTNKTLTSPTLTTPILGTPSSGTLSSCTGLPISTGVSGLGTGIATALAVNTGSAGAPVLFNGALGTPTSGTVTNLTGTASINTNGAHNGSVGATTPSTGAFTTLSATGITLSTGDFVGNSGTQILGDNGTVGAPFFSFDGDADTGAYRPTANRFGIAAGGSLIGDFSAAGLAVTGALSATGALSITATAASSISRTLSVGALIASGNLSGLGFVPNSTGLSAGYNYSGGDAETNMIFGASSSSQQMRFQRWDGTSLTTVLTLDGSGHFALGAAPLSDRQFYITGATNTTGANQFGVVQNPTFPNTVTGSLFNLYISANLTAGATLTNSYGLYVEAGSYGGSTVSNKYGIYQAGTSDRNYFAGNLLVGLTATSAYMDGALDVQASGESPAICAKLNPSSSTKTQFVYSAWAPFTTGDNIFMQFETETSATVRGAISYNRGAGLVAYNVTSDYRAKDIFGPVVDSGALIDAVPVYMGKMKGATLERPMFIAHETPAYAHTGEKDAVDTEGNPVYQQIDNSTLVPVLWAEIQSLRQRVAALETK